MKENEVGPLPRLMDQRPKSRTLIEENIGINLCNIQLGNDFFRDDTKITRDKINK